MLSVLQRIWKKRRCPPVNKTRVFLLHKCPHKKGTCIRICFVAPKKPNSATRKVAKLVFTKFRRNAFCYIPGIKHNLQKFSTVLMRGGRTKDLPGLKYKAVRGVHDLKPVYERFKARSKYGIKKHFV